MCVCLWGEGLWHTQFSLFSARFILHLLNDVLIYRIWFDYPHRCRPFLSCDGSEAIEAKPSLNFHADGTSLSLATGTKGSGQTFAFDQVLPTTSSQTDVYNGISDLVQSSLDGYRVCIFSYGQTGSGKVFYCMYFWCLTVDFTNSLQFYLFYILKIFYYPFSFDVRHIQWQGTQEMRALYLAQSDTSFALH